jgi:hypothetical protein
VAKLIFKGVSLHIVPESNSVFHNVEPWEGRILPIKFIRNKVGASTGVFILGNDYFEKVKN